MFTEEKINDFIDSEDKKYLNNKFRGGENNRKGNEYELKYCVVKIYEAIEKYFNDNIDYILHYQPKCFVDDLIVYTDSENLKINNYQIKDVQSLGWKSGNHTLEEDFKKQYELCKNLDFPEDKIKNCIVVSRNSVSETLKETMPNEIKEFSKVKHFENKNNYEYINDYRNKMSYLTAEKNPEPEVFGYLQTIISGTWINLSGENKIKFSEFYEILKSTKHVVVRDEPFELPKDVSTQLLKIKNFRFDTSRGHFNWEYGDFEKNLILCKGIIDKRNLEFFYRQVRNEKPENFNDIEGVL